MDFSSYIVDYTELKLFDFDGFDSDQGSMSSLANQESLNYSFQDLNLVSSTSVPSSTS